jgi:acyl carrier protein
MMVNLNDIKSILENSNLRRINVTNLLTDIPLVEQGLDSLDMFNVFLNVEEKYNIKIEDKDFDVLKTINDIVAFIDNRANL